MGLTSDAVSNLFLSPDFQIYNCKDYSRVPNNRGVRITVLVGKILKFNNREGPNNSVGGKKFLKSNNSVGPNNRVGGTKTKFNNSVGPNNRVGGKRHPKLIILFTR